MSASVSDITPWQERTVQQTLDMAMGAELSEVLVIGKQDGELYSQSSKMSRKDALWLIELARQHVLYSEQPN